MKFRYGVKCLNANCNRGYEEFKEGNVNLNARNRQLEMEKVQKILEPNTCKYCGNQNIRVEDLVDSSTLSDINFGIDYYEVLGLENGASRTQILSTINRLNTEINTLVRTELPAIIRNEAITELRQKLGKEPTEFEVNYESQERISPYELY